MNEISMSIGPLMKAARKFKKFNQSDVAQAIGCSQSALSKMEHNLLVPSAPQWFLFSRFTSIPPETIETGIIDRHTKVKLNNDNISLGFKLPKRYRMNRAEKVREVYPFLLFLEKTDPNLYKEFTHNLAIDSEFFLDFDNLVSFQLMVDLINQFIRIGKNSEQDIKELVSFGQNIRYWDKSGEDWKACETPLEVFEAYAKDQKSFQGDFNFQVKAGQNKIFVSYLPESHVYPFLKDAGAEVKVFLTTYRKYSLEHLIQKTLKQSVEVRAASALAITPLEDHFEIYS